MCNNTFLPLKNKCSCILRILVEYLVMQAIFRLFVGMELYPFAMELHCSQGFPDRNAGHLKFK